jgi:hypothetical protein
LNKGNPLVRRQIIIKVIKEAEEETKGSIVSLLTSRKSFKNQAKLFCSILEVRGGQMCRV